MNALKKRRNEIWFSIIVIALGLLGSGCGDGGSNSRRQGRIDQRGQVFQGQLVGAWKAVDTPQIRYTQQKILGHYILIGRKFTDFVSVYHMFNGKFSSFDGLDLDGWGYYEMFQGRIDVEFLASRTVLSQYFDFNRKYNIASTLRQSGQNQISFTLDGFKYTLQRMSQNELTSVFGKAYQKGNVENLLDDLVEHWDLF